MQYFFLIILAILMPHISHAKCPCRGKKRPPPQPKPYEEDQRHDPFALALKLMEEKGIQTIVETGAASGIWAAWARDHQAALHTAARSTANAVLSDSILFLQRFNQPIDFLYLESDPDPNQSHCMQEIIATPWLTPKSIVMIAQAGNKAVVDYLLERGWKIYESSDLVIFIHP